MPYFSSNRYSYCFVNWTRGCCCFRCFNHHIQLCAKVFLCPPDPPVAMGRVNVAPWSVFRNQKKKTVLFFETPQSPPALRHQSGLRGHVMWPTQQGLWLPEDGREPDPSFLFHPRIREGNALWICLAHRPLMTCLETPRSRKRKARDQNRHLSSEAAWSRHINTLAFDAGLVVACDAAPSRICVLSLVTWFFLQN